MDTSLIIAVLLGIAVIAVLLLVLRKGTPPAAVQAKPESKAVKEAEPVAAPLPQAAPSLAPEAGPVKKAAAKKPAPTRKAPAARTQTKPAARKAAPAPVKKAASATRPSKSVKRAPAPVTAIGVPGAMGAADNLLLLKGVGPKLNTLLAGLGITRFDQIGAWTADDVAKVNAHLGTFAGRIERDSWVEQAALLARGAIAEFEAKFGKLDSEN